MMRRMGWIITYPLEFKPIIDIIEFYERQKDELAGLHPVLSPSHPEYDFYCKIFIFMENKFSFIGGFYENKV